MSIKRVRGFLKWEPYLADFKKEQLADVPAPKRIGFWKVPSDLSGLTFEGLVRLWSIRSTTELFRLTASVVIGMPAPAVMLLPLFPTLPMLGAVNMVRRELQKIQQAFDSISEIKKPTRQELEAGCQDLKHGVFGIADWYAQRMGITDHDEAFRTKWTRIYQCLRNDAETAEYRRRLNKIMADEMAAGGKRR